MGEVFLAEDTRLGRRVALKFLPTLLVQNKEHLRRFEQEARAIAALSHPNVCAIHEVVETEEGRHCIVMEYVEGLTLRERIAEGPMTTGEALDAAIQIASALRAAHAAGIVHRDIKPENLILRRDGYVKILDFGLAKLSGKESATIDTKADTRVMALKTTPGMVLGTAAYMSPEQARGLPVDERTDIWSLGVVLYEMLAGRQPFHGATPMDLIISIAGTNPEPLMDAPAQLNAITQKALAKDCEARYQTAETMLADLKSLRHELEIEPEVIRREQSIPDGNGSTASVSNGLTGDFTGLKNHRMLLLAAIGAILVAGLVAILFFRNSTPLSQPEIKSLAVLPLENLSGDSAQEYFADGMTEALITDLAKIGALRVISRQSVMQYKLARRPLPEIARELNVDAVLTGSMSRSGERVRIAVHLIHAATDRNLWTHNYERDLRDILALQRDVARDVASEIRIKLTPQEQTQFGSAAPVNPEAYDQYLLGKFHLYRQKKENNAAAISALERAVAVDPAFAAAHAELAQAYVWMLFLFAPEDKTLGEKAFVSAEKALALDPNLAVAYLARGRLLWTPANRFPHEKAIREYRRALELNPNLDEARNQLALVYNHVGALDEALRELERALAINPNNTLVQFRIAETLLFQGKYEQALVDLRKVPDDTNPALVLHQIVWALINLGRKEEAAAELERIIREFPDDNRGLFTSQQAVLAAAAGQDEIAEEKIKQAVERGKGFGHFHHTAYHIACAYALMNKPEQAVKWLEDTSEHGFPNYPMFERDVPLQKIKDDPRFIAFMAKLKPQWERYQKML